MRKEAFVEGEQAFSLMVHREACLLMRTLATQSPQCLTGCFFPKLGRSKLTKDLLFWINALCT